MGRGEAVGPQLRSSPGRGGRGQFFGLGSRGPRPAGFNDFSGSITATYYNAVAIGNAAPVGDIYAGFRLDFGNGTYANGLGENSITNWQYNFTLDTDNATTDIVQRVPEPGTAAVLGLGLLGLIASRRRSRKG